MLPKQWIFKSQQVPTYYNWTGVLKKKMLPGEPTYNRGIQILPKISQEDLHPCKHRATEHESWGIQYREWKAPSAYGRWYSAGIQITCEWWESILLSMAWECLWPWNSIMYARNMLPPSKTSIRLCHYCYTQMLQALCGDTNETGWTRMHPALCGLSLPFAVTDLLVSLAATIHASQQTHVLTCRT